jgi:hypothetical protein
MTLTTAQETAFADAVKNSGDPLVQQAYSVRNDVFLTEWANSNSTSWVWRTRVTQDEIMQNGFDWVRVDNLSVGKARIWEWLFLNADRAINPSKPNVRAGIQECWKGTAADLAVQAAVLGHCKKLCSVIENLFATGTKTEQDPGALVYVGPVSLTEVSVALNRNP